MSSKLTISPTHITHTHTHIHPLRITQYTQSADISHNTLLVCVTHPIGHGCNSWTMNRLTKHCRLTNHRPSHYLRFIWNFNLRLFLRKKKSRLITLYSHNYIVAIGNRSKITKIWRSAVEGMGTRVSEQQHSSREWQRQMIHFVWQLCCGCYLTTRPGLDLWRRITSNAVGATKQMTGGGMTNLDGLWINPWMIVRSPPA